MTRAAIVEALDVPAGDAEIDAADHHVALFLGIDERFVHAFHGGLEIDDLAFAHAARRRLADAENVDRAVGPAFADDGANFRGADFESDHEITAAISLNRFFPRLTGIACGSAAPMALAFAASPAPADGPLRQRINRGRFQNSRLRRLRDRSFR